MSKSQIKRLHQQQEAEKANLEVEEEKEPAEQRKGPANRFAFFDDEDAADSDGASEGSEEHSEATASVKKNDKKKAKKNKKKGKKEKEAELEETENQMLARLAAANLKEAKTAVDDPKSLEELMKVDFKLFDISAELKRKLGSVFFKETANQADDSEENRWPPGRRPIGRIVKNRPRWLPENDNGLSMVQEKTESDGVVWFKLKHNNHYEQRERLFWSLEKGMQIAGLNELLQDTPYHLNTLLVMGNMARMTEDLNLSAEIIEKGIFYVDQHSAPTFEPFNWRHRMDYTDYENRVFFLLLHRHMLNAVLKKCFETALNTAKLIFKLDPKHDPLATMSIIDTYALRAKQYTWLIRTYESGKDFKKLELLPNWPYSVALAMHFTAKTAIEKEDAELALCTAIRHFPSVVVQLMDILQIVPDPAVMNCKMLTSFKAGSEPESLKLLVKMYAEQTQDVWKQPDVLLFLEKCTRHVALCTEHRAHAECYEWKFRRHKMYHGRSPNVDRLAILLEMIPTLSISNPIPPKDGRCGYHREDPETPRRFTDNFLGALVHSLLPHFDSEHTLVEVIERRRDEIMGMMNNGLHTVNETVRRMVFEERGVDIGEVVEAEPRVVRLDNEEVELPEQNEQEQQEEEEQQDN